MLQVNCHQLSINRYEHNEFDFKKWIRLSRDY